MAFRLKALAVHLLASASVLTLVLGALYVGWYRWPGWYLSDCVSVLIVLAGVDVAVGPLLTCVVAHPGKPPRQLRRDIAIIVTIQICALLYGSVSLWRGRPLYYAFSENVLQLVQAYDINADELALARRQNAPIVPRWYSLPRWIWAPLPEDPEERARIFRGALSGGDDVIAMPRYYRPWERGLPLLMQQLKRVDDVPYFARSQKNALKEAMRASGLDPQQLNAIAFTGRGNPLLAVFDPGHQKLRAVCRLSSTFGHGPTCQPSGG
jgi:hypothetical protein